MSKEKEAKDVAGMWWLALSWGVVLRGDMDRQVLR